MRPLQLTLLPDEFAICRLPPETPLDDVPAAGAFLSLTRTPDELSVVLPAAAAPSRWRCERGWRAFGASGPLEFDETGVLASLAEPLARAGVSLFAISTFDTDYVLVRAANVERAAEALVHAGHTIAGYARPASGGGA